jgi:hypothetical protein
MIDNVKFLQICQTFESEFFAQLGKEAGKHAASGNLNERARARTIIVYADDLARLIAENGRSLSAALTLKAKADKATEDRP